MTKKYEKQKATWARDRRLILFYYLSNPGISMAETGKHFGKSKQWISRVIKKAKKEVGVAE